MKSQKETDPCISFFGRHDTKIQFYASLNKNGAETLNIFAVSHFILENLNLLILSLTKSNKNKKKSSSLQIL